MRQKRQCASPQTRPSANSHAFACYVSPNSYHKKSFPRKPLLSQPKSRHKHTNQCSPEPKAHGEAKPSHTHDPKHQGACQPRSANSHQPTCVRVIMGNYCRQPPYFRVVCHAATVNLYTFLRGWGARVQGGDGPGDL